MRDFIKSAGLLLIPLVLNACIVVPVPWFPENPYKVSLERLLEQEIVLREDILKEFGQPWAAWDERSFIYISDRPSSYLLLGTQTSGDVVEMTRRDFVLMFNFDELGILIDHEAFADTGDRDFCFSNNVCFSQATDNVLLRPLPVKNYASESENHDFCTVYLFRDEVVGSKTFKSYADIHLRKDNEGSFIPIGSSVAEGINVWQMEPASNYELKAGFTSVHIYPFEVPRKQRISRKEIILPFSCDPGQQVYARLAVPKSEKEAIEFSLVNESSANDAMKGLPDLLGYYAPEILCY